MMVIIHMNAVRVSKNLVTLRTKLMKKPKIELHKEFPQIRRKLIKKKNASKDVL